MRIQAKIQKWGNSLALKLTGPWKSIPHFEENMLVDIDVTEEGIQIRPIKRRATRRLPFSEAQLLKGLNAKTVHA